MPTDSFRWLPRSIAGFYQTMEVLPYDSIPWTPLTKPLEECRIALVTTAGLCAIARRRREIEDVVQWEGW